MTSTTYEAVDMTGIKLSAGIAIVSGSSSMVIASQQLIDPDTTLVSLGVLVTIVGIAVTATAVVLRFVFRVDSRLDTLDSRVRDLEKHE
jgi:hypothetical protein|tara:strand:+ start:637 stop:903 length:267 start_codon:yes stop_codon:yes gene_type:complete